MSSLTAAEAARLLGVKPATLYAYVSRGLVRSEPGPAGTRERRYHAQDVHALLDRQTVRRDPEGAVQEAVGGALHWGVPVLDSALTLIAGGRVRYRGQDAVTLARHASVEEVAALLWTGDPGGWAQLPLKARMPLQPLPPASSGSEALAYALAHAGAHDLTAGDTRPGALPAQAARVLNLLYATLERFERIPPAPDLALHARLARAWNAPQSADLLRRALIVTADHELNVSAFTARVTASGGANLHHVTLAALCALQGRQHGLSVVETAELITHARRDGPARALRDAARRQARLPGFGHRLYPDGDPRAGALLGALEDSAADHPALEAVRELAALVHAETGERPNIDLALGALGQVLGRGTEDAVTLFALGRAVGWLAHALEAFSGGQMIRPRARYVGRLEE